MITPKLQSSDKYTLNRSKVSQNGTYGKTDHINRTYHLLVLIFCILCIRATKTLSASGENCQQVGHQKHTNIFKQFGEGGGHKLDLIKSGAHSISNNSGEAWIFFSNKHVRYWILYHYCWAKSGSIYHPQGPKRVTETFNISITHFQMFHQSVLVMDKMVCF